MCGGLGAPCALYVCTVGLEVMIYLQQLLDEKSKIANPFLLKNVIISLAYVFVISCSVYIYV